MAENPDTQPEILEMLFNESEEGEVIKLLAENPSVPSEILNKIKDGDYFIANNISAEKWFPPSLFCNPDFDTEAKKYLPYQEPERFKSIR